MRIGAWRPMPAYCLGSIQDMMTESEKKHTPTFREAWIDLGDTLVKVLRIDKIARWLNDRLTRKSKSFWTPMDPPAPGTKYTDPDSTEYIYKKD